MEYKVIVDSYGTYWYKPGTEIHHRLNGPAIEDGAKYWYQNGLLHRLDGPAVEDYDGKKYWYIEGVQYTEEEFNKEVKKV